MENHELLDDLVALDEPERQAARLSPRRGAAASSIWHLAHADSAEIALRRLSNQPIHVCAKHVVDSAIRDRHV